MIFFQLRLNSGSMEIFKLLESTIPNVQPGHPRTKDLRRDQLLDKYDEAILSLQTLIKAKESEIVYKRDLIDVLDKCKSKCDNKMISATQNYQLAKKHAPESLLKEISSKRSAESQSSTSSTTAVPTSANATPSGLNLTPASSHQQQQQTVQQLKNSELDIPLPSESMDNRSSLDRRLSEFLKTFPNLTQAGLATPTSNNNNIKPMPGYYTQQPPPPPISSAPPLMAMMRFPPPPIIAPPNPHPNLTVLTQQHVGENHDMADMDLSDYDESSNTGGVALGPPTSGTSSEGGAELLPMIASAVQQGAGGKHHAKQEFPAQPQTSYGGGGGQQYNNSMTFAPRLNPLPFDPSIMEPRLGGSSSSSGGSRGDKHSHGDRTAHRHSSSSGSSSGARHTPEKNKYSTSSHSSNRSKRR